MCQYLLHVDDENFHPGGTCLRGEAMSPADRCQLKPKKDNFGRKYDILRWIYSGGSAVSVAHACTGNCPLKVPADVGNYGQSWTGPCPICRTIARRTSPGAVNCKECGQKFELVDRT